MAQALFFGDRGRVWVGSIFAAYVNFEMGAGSDMKLMKSLNEELGVAEEEDGTEDGADLRLDSILRLPVSSTEGTSQRKPSSRSLSTGKARKESSLGGSSSTTRVDKFAGVVRVHKT